MNQEEERKITLVRTTMAKRLAGVALQVGCFTIVIIFIALLAGIWLDKTFGTRGTFVISLILGSIPITWIIIFWIVGRAKKQIKNEKSNIKTEDVTGDKP